MCRVSYLRNEFVRLSYNCVSSIFTTVRILYSHSICPWTNIFDSICSSVWYCIPYYTVRRSTTRIICPSDAITSSGTNYFFDACACNQFRRLPYNKLCSVFTQLIILHLNMVHSCTQVLSNTNFRSS